jgi:pimeloyl-ACP methyl ester carboxylesterase
MLRLLSNVPRDLATCLPHVKAGDDIVFLVHGFFATAGVFRPMRAEIERGGARAATFTHAPGMGVDRIARSLARLVERVHAGARVHIVGHSLGGLVARWYVQELGGHERVTQTISLATPFGGTPIARRVPFFGSDLAAAIDRIRTGPLAGRVPHASVYGTNDRLVPPDSAAFEHGEVVAFRGRSHNSLLFDEDVIRFVAGKIRAYKKEREVLRSA